MEKTICFDKNNSEIVFGIIKTVGIDSDGIIKTLKNTLEAFEYTVNVIKVSEVILSEFSDKSKDFKDEYKRIDYYMSLGNELRNKKQDNSFLMKGVCSYIYETFRKEEDSPLERYAYIIDSIKHPDEIEFLRRTYGDGFHLIGIFDTYDNRMKHLTKFRNIEPENAKKLIDRDYNEGTKSGQNTRDAYQNSDYFINLNSKIRPEENIQRLVYLLFGNVFITPTFEEYAMFRAYVASLRSADLSRQIGSVIVKESEIIAEGVNDCPKAFGGLYWPIIDEGEYRDINNGRDYTLGYDTNKKEQAHLIQTIIKNLKIEETPERIEKIKNSGIGQLTEYGRVVHSEMEAILMCARIGESTKNTEMYVMTFPCHNCAKHIIAAGIKKVVYIEPYPKSKAFEFYPNEITEDINNDKKVQFIPFNGVGPHKFIDLFSMQSIKSYNKTRKNSDGTAIKWDIKNASLRNPMNQFNYIDMEKLAYMEYINKLGGNKNEREEN